MRLFIVLLASIVGLSSPAATLDLGKAKNEVEFLAVGKPSALKIKGQAKDSSALSGQIVINGQTLNLNAALKLSALDTGIEMRDKHMKEKYLEVGKYPQAELTISGLGTQANEVPFKGMMKLHGKNQPISGKASTSLKGSELELNLDFTLLLKDYMIEIPSYLGITVANDVKVTAKSQGKVL